MNKMDETLSEMEQANKRTDLLLEQSRKIEQIASLQFQTVDNLSRVFQKLEEIMTGINTMDSAIVSQFAKNVHSVFHHLKELQEDIEARQSSSQRDNDTSFNILGDE